MRLEVREGGKALFLKPETVEEGMQLGEFYGVNCEKINVCLWSGGLLFDLKPMLGSLPIEDLEYPIVITEKDINKNMKVTLSEIEYHGYLKRIEPGPLAKGTMQDTSLILEMHVIGIKGINNLIK